MFHVLPSACPDRYGCAGLGLDSRSRQQLARFAQLLVEVAGPRGLVGGGPSAVGLHIARSLLLLQALGRPRSFIDVGSGAGLPGIPLAIALGRGILIEPRGRAAGFLERVVRDLGLEVEVVVRSAEEAARASWREMAEAVVARGLGPAPVAAELCAPLCSVGGRVLLTAAPGRRVISLPSSALELLGLGKVRVMSLASTSIPAIQQEVLMMSKVRTTSAEFPRGPGIARRKPLR